MNLASLIAALIAVESSGNNLAIGDGGKAIGPLQIHREVVTDVNRISGKAFQWRRMTNRAEATQVCTIYLNHYATPARLGRPVSAQDAARIWNGGPSGHRKSATIPYANKVKKHLKP